MFDNQACAPFLHAQALYPSLIKGAPAELIATVENAVSRVLGQHGLSAFEMPREAAIAHEAAHAVVQNAPGSRLVPEKGKPPDVPGGFPRVSGCKREGDARTTATPANNQYEGPATF